MVRYGDIKDSFGSGGANVAPGGSAGDPSMRETVRALLGAISASYADSTALTASLAADRVNAQLSVKADDYSLWVWKSTDATSPDANHIRPTDVGSGAGRWVNLDFVIESLAPQLASTAPADPDTAAAAVGVGTTAARADHKHHIGVATGSVAGLMSAVDKASFATIQTGTGTLTNGVSASIPATLTANSIVLCTRTAKNASTAYGTIDVLDADKTPGTPGAFVARAFKADTTAETSDQSSFRWFVFN